MNLFKKAGSLIGASALVGLAVFAGAVGVANAAPVTLVIEPAYLAPGETLDLTIDGCSVGAVMALMVNGESLVSDTVGEGDLPYSVGYDYEDLDPGTTMEFSVTCTPAADSTEAPSNASDTITVFGASYVESVPDTFYTGETVSVTAGDFLPGTAVSLAVIPSGSETPVYSTALGSAAADFSVTGNVVFPKDLECGDYMVQISGGEDVVTAELRICGAPVTSPSPSPSPSVSVTPSVSPSTSAQPSATASPSRPTPGLPSTGN